MKLAMFLRRAKEIAYACMQSMPQSQLPHYGKLHCKAVFLKTEVFRCSQE
jgi:hypothetical protein